MVNFKTDVTMKFSNGNPAQRVVVITHELFGRPAEFIGYILPDEASVKLARRVVAFMRRRGVKGRCKHITEEEALKYYPQDWPLSAFT